MSMKNQNHHGSYTYFSNGLSTACSNEANAMLTLFDGIAIN